MKTPLKGIEIKDITQKRETATQPTLIDMQQNNMTETGSCRQAIISYIKQITIKLESTIQSNETCKIVGIFNVLAQLFCTKAINHLKIQNHTNR